MTTVLAPSTVHESSEAAQGQLTGTPSEIESAERIRTGVGDEFDRVAEELLLSSGKRAERDRTDTRAMIAILEEERLEVLRRTEAGYFIKDWQELTNQVSQLVRGDSRYQVIRSAKAERKRPANQVEAPVLPQITNTAKGDLYL